MQSIGNFILYWFQCFDSEPDMFAFLYIYFFSIFIFLVFISFFFFHFYLFLSGVLLQTLLAHQVSSFTSFHSNQSISFAVLMFLFTYAFYCHLKIEYPGVCFFLFRLFLWITAKALILATHFSGFITYNTQFYFAIK